MNDKHPYEKVLRLMAHQRPIQVMDELGRWVDVEYPYPLNAILNSMGTFEQRRSALTPDKFRERPKTVQLGHWDVTIPTRVSNDLDVPVKARSFVLLGQYFYWDTQEQHEAFMMALSDLLNGELL
jgi:hypothetical protein